MRLLEKAKAYGTDEQESSAHDDIRIIDQRMVLDNGRVDCFLYHLAVKEEGKVHVFWKSVKMMRVERVPVELRLNRELLDVQRDICSAMYEDEACMVTVIGNSTQSSIGTVFCYGVQCVADEPGKARYMADAKMAGLVAALEGAYSQIEIFPLTANVGNWMMSTMETMDEILVVRGVPRPRNAANSDANQEKDGNTDYASEEQIEEIIRGMQNHNYLVICLGSPVSKKDIGRQLQKISDVLSKYKSQVRGQRSIGVNLIFPVGMMGSLGEGKGVTRGQTSSDMYETSTNETHVDSQSMSEGTGQSWGMTHQDTVSETDGVNRSDSLSSQEQEGESVSLSEGQGERESYQMGERSSVNETQGFSDGRGFDESTSQGVRESQSEGWNTSRGEGTGESTVVSRGGSEGDIGGTNRMAALGEGTSSNESLTRSSTVGDTVGDSFSKTDKGGLSFFFGGGAGNTDATAHNHSTNGSEVDEALSINASESDSEVWTSSDSWSRMNTWQASDTNSNSQMQSQSLSGNETYGNNESATMGKSLSQSDSNGFKQSASEGMTEGVRLGQTRQASASQSLSRGDTAGQSFGDGRNTGNSDAYGYSEGRTTQHSDGGTSGQSYGSGIGEGLTDSQGVSQSLMRTSAIASSVGVIPSINWMKTLQTFEANANNISEILDVFRNRLFMAIQEGGFMYEMYVLTDREEPEAQPKARALVKSAWWGANTWPLPIETIDLPHDKEQHMATHAQAFSFCRERSHKLSTLEPYRYSTFINSNEMAAMTHPPRCEAPGLSTAMENAPVFRLPTVDKTKKYAKIGYLYNGETGKVDYNLPRVITEDQYKNHWIISGQTGSGKSVSAIRMVYAQIKAFGCSAVILDWSQQWRALKNLVENITGPNGKKFKFKFYSLGNPKLCPIGFNLLKAPRGVDAETWAASLAESFALAYGLGLRGFGIIVSLISRLYKRVGADEDPEKTGDVDMTDLYREIKKEIDMLPEMGAKVGADFKDSVAIIMSRLRFYAPHTNLGTMYSKKGKRSVDDFIKNDEIIVMEGFGLGPQAKTFIISVIATGIFLRGKIMGDGSFLDDNGLGGKLLVLEEAHQVLSGTMEASAKESNPMDIPETWSEILFNEGRSQGLYATAIVQSVERVPIACINNAGGLMAHRSDVEKDKQIIVAALSKEWRYESRDLFKYLTRLPRGYSVNRYGYFTEYVDSEPSISYTKPLALSEPTDDELRQAFEQ